MYRNSSASRAVALDLMLRTFMTSYEFQSCHSKIWESVSKLVPGTTPQQCAQRWEQLRDSWPVVGDHSGLSAEGKLIGHSSTASAVRRQPQKHTHTRSTHSLKLHASNEAETTVGATDSSSEESASIRSPKVKDGTLARAERIQSGKFVTNYCQSIVNERTDIAMEPDTTEPSESREKSFDTNPVKSVGNAAGPSMIIHVCDEAKNLKKDFVCPREILVREMKYFKEYLSSETQLWDEIDISVHCDVPVFEWLIKYAKRGMTEGPCGESLDEPLTVPSLAVSTVVSILISSDFLRMDTLVDESLDFCCKKISEVVATPCNMSCITGNLLKRLAERFTPHEVEEIIDKKDKIRSKLFICKIEELFNSHSPEYPSTASTIFKCKYCNRILTTEQKSFFPCCSTRLTVSRTGKIVFRHEIDTTWDINSFVHKLHQDQWTPREIYWKVWGIVNWMECESCKLPFQCCELNYCAYHPRPTRKSGTVSNTYPCCKQPIAMDFSTTSCWQNGCTFKDHKPTQRNSYTSKPADALISVLLLYRNIICSQKLVEATKVSTLGINSTRISLLLDEAKKSCNIQKLEHKATPHVVQCPKKPIAGEKTRPSSAQMKSVLLAPRSRNPHEMEEDECDINHKFLAVGMKSYRHRRSDFSSSTTNIEPLEWTWNNRKSKRWNQDMQRESNEKRLLAMEQDAERKEPSQTGGGIYSQLEAQFKAKRASEAQTGSRLTQHLWKRRSSGFQQSN